MFNIYGSLWSSTSQHNIKLEILDLTRKGINRFIYFQRYVKQKRGFRCCNSNKFNLQAFTKQRKQTMTMTYISFLKPFSLTLLA